MGEPALAEPEGAYAPEPGKVAIKDLDGTVSKIPVADFNAAQAEGAKPATQAEYFGAAHGTGGQIAAGLVGAARGASFGGSDALYIEGARALAGDESAEGVRNTINLLKESHADANQLGEVGGAVVPMLFGGGGAARGATSLGEGFLARAGARALEAAPRALAEGTAIGLGQQLSEDELQNHKLTAEHYVTAGLKGGAIGVLLGGTAAAGIGAASDKVAGMFGRRIEGAAEQGLAREENTIYRGATHAAEDEGSTVGEKGYFAKKLEEGPDVLRFKGATNAKVSDIRRMGADAGTQEARAAELGRVLKNETTAEGQPLVGPLVTQVESAKRIATRLNEVGASLRPLYRELDTAAVRPSTSAIALRFADEVAAPALALPLGEAEVAPAQKYLKSLIGKSGEAPTFEHLWAVRKKVDDLLKGDYAKPLGATASTTGAESLRGLRGIIDDELISAADKASAELGTGIGDKLRVTNSLYRDLATVNKIAQHQAALTAGSNAISLTDVLSGMTGGVTGLAMGGANMVRRKLGNQLAAHVLDKVSRMQAVQNAATRLDNMLSSGTRAFVEGKGGPAIRKAVPVTAEEVRQLRQVTSNPSAVTARVADALGDLPRYAPKVAAAAATTIQRQAAYLNQVLPREPPPPGLSFGKQPQRPISDTERIKAQHVIETVKDPSIIVDRLREGRLTQTHVDALKASSPETFLQIQNYIRQHGEELKPALTVQQECNLAILFGQPINEASQPANLKAFQASFVSGNQAPGGAGGGGGGGGGSPMKTPTKATAFDKMESGQS